MTGDKEPFITNPKISFDRECGCTLFYTINLKYSRDC